MRKLAAGLVAVAVVAVLAWWLSDEQQVRRTVDRTLLAVSEGRVSDVTASLAADFVGPWQWSKPQIERVLALPRRQPQGELSVALKREDYDVIVENNTARADIVIEIRARERPEAQWIDVLASTGTSSEWSIQLRKLDGEWRFSKAAPWRSRPLQFNP